MSGCVVRSNTRCFWVGGLLILFHILPKLLPIRNFCSLKERAFHEKDLLRMLQTRGGARENVKAEKATAQAQHDKDEHIASFDCAHALFNVTLLWAQVPLDYFLHTGPLPVDKVPRALYQTMDFLQIQWRVHWFLRNKCALSTEAFIDLTHRRQRDLRLAEEESLYGGTRDKALVAINVHFGPWLKASFHQDIKETAEDLSENLDPDDPSLMWFWDDITFEMEWPEDMRNREGRKIFLAKLPNYKGIATKGDKANKGSWGSLINGWRHAKDGFVACENFVVSNLALRRKWIPDLSVLVAPDDDASVPAEVDAAGPEAEAAPAPKAKAKAAPEPKATAKAKCKAAAAKERSKIAADRSRAVNTLHCVLKWKCDKNFIHKTRQLVLAEGAEYDEHNYYLTQVLTPSATREYWAELAAGRWMEPLRQTLGTLCDVVALHRSGFVTDPGVAAACSLDSPLVLLEDAKAQQYMSLVFSIVRHRASRTGKRVADGYSLFCN